MGIDLKSVIVTLVIVFGALAALKLYLFLTALSKLVQEQNQKIATLLSANRKRMPYESYEAVLDALAAIDADERESEFHASLRHNARAHLFRAIREGTKREDK